MPLLDHFHAPLSPVRNWESFHAVWSTAIVENLNETLLPENYFAETQVHLGGRVEVDVASFEENGGLSSDRNGGIATKAWAPPAPAMTMPAIFPDEVEIQVFQSSGGATLVAALELISPGNKDRPEARRAFAAKCMSYLQSGVGLIIIDAVTDRLANLHDEIVRLMQQADTFRFPDASPLYAVSYRPSRREQGGDTIDMWPKALQLGKPLPTMPLALANGPVLPLDLEATYMEARRKSRL
jgi:hypothetical protein